MKEGGVEPLFPAELLEFVEIVAGMEVIVHAVKTDHFVQFVRTFQVEFFAKGVEKFAKIFG